MRYAGRPPAWPKRSAGSGASRATATCPSSSPPSSANSPDPDEGGHRPHRRLRRSHTQDLHRRSTAAGTTSVAEHFTVIAPDLRGAGGSDAPADGYTKSSLAEDIHDLLVGLGLAEQVSLVGHDIGTMVAYAYAAAHRDSTSRLVLIEAPLPDEDALPVPLVHSAGPRPLELRVLHPPERPARADARRTRGHMARRIRRLARGGQGRR